jgi:hypothetical protein
MVISWVAQNVNIEDIPYNSSEHNQGKKPQNLFHQKSLVEKPAENTAASTCGRLQNFNKTKSTPHVALAASSSSASRSRVFIAWLARYRFRPARKRPRE